jgi:transcriptional regulator with XRE-family HTH domain
MAIGPTLQEARLKKQLTTSQVAERTRMKVQFVDDLERDDFHRMAATIYGKGFIRLFAECVGLDPNPLVADYVRSVEGDTPSLLRGGDTDTLISTVEAITPELKTKQNLDVDTDTPEPAETDADLFAYAKTKKRVVTPRHDSSSSTLKHTVSETASHSADVVKAKCSVAVSACRNAMEHAANRLADVPWGDAPLKVVGIIIGILVVLLFVVSGISRCTGPQGVDARLNTALEIAVDPPEPYFD